MSQDVLGTVSVHEAKGLTTDLLEKLSGKNGREWIVPAKRFLRKENPWPLFGAPNLRFDRRRDGFEPLEHKPRIVTAASDLELVPFLRDGEKSIRGYDLIGRARYELGADLGQEDAEFLLDRQVEIPVEFRPFYLLFTATIWRYPDGHLFVACLRFDGERWYLDWYWLGDGDGSRVRLLRLRRK